MLKQWNSLWNFAAFAPEGEAGAAAAPVAAPAPQDAGTILYPDDKPAPEAPAAETPAPTDQAPAAEAWKEYAPDPAKTDAENAAAKAEHDKGKPADDADKVPDDGVYKLVMPEGVELDTVLLDALAPEFKAAGLTVKQAQVLADKFVAHQQSAAKEQAEGWAKTISDWADAAKADPEIGGAKWDATVRHATSVIGRFATPEFKEYLNASGAGNHPEVIRFMARLGAMIGEDAPAVSEAQSKRVSGDRAEVLYPDDKPKP
jgi:hypothetical protein